jgi:hypothetical protein
MKFLCVGSQVSVATKTPWSRLVELGLPVGFLQTVSRETALAFG